MTIDSELKAEVKSIFSRKWETRKGQIVPDSEDLGLGNDAVKLNGTVLYADLSESTKLVNDFRADFVAEVYKAYLHCAAKIIRSEGGTITSYDGDRVMAVFIGESKNTSAVRASLKINYSVQKIINPALISQYKDANFQLRQTVGIDNSTLFVSRTGIRGSNDLVWVGRAANYAAKLTELSPDYPTWITDSVYNVLHESAKTYNGTSMWEARTWTNMNNHTVYRSSWWWET